MNQERFKISDNSQDRKYFTVIPNYIVNHSTALEQGLYLNMKRIAGEDGSCWASPATIGKSMGISANTVRKYRDKLEKRRWIRKIGERGKTKPTNEYEIVDLWEMNMQFYAKKESSTIEQSKKKVQMVSEIVQPVSLVSSTVGNKEEPYKKNHEEDKERGRFTPPSLQEVTNYCLERKNGISPNQFIDFYSSKGWLIGKNKMKDWRAAVRTWEGRQKGQGNKLTAPAGKYENL